MLQDHECLGVIVLMSARFRWFESTYASLLDWKPLVLQAIGRFVDGPLCHKVLRFLGLGWQSARHADTKGFPCELMYL